jgi:PAS domain S-box-containing protein
LAMRNSKQSEEYQRFALLSENQRTRKLIKIIVSMLFAWGFLQCALEIIVSGTQNQASLYVCSLATITASLCFYLIRLNRIGLVKWILLWGVWGIIVYAVIFRDGMTAPGIVMLPVLIILSLFLTGNSRGALSLTVASITVLLAVELSEIYGLLDYEGITTPFLRVTTIIAILIISYFISNNLMAHFLEQKRLTEELKLVTENSPMMLAVVANKGTYLFVNSEYARFHGRTPAQMIGSSVEDLEGDAVFARYLYGAQQAPAERHYESKREDALGQAHWFDVIVSPIEGSSDKEFHIMLRDISEEKRAKQQLADSERDHRSIIESSIDPYYRTDLEGRIILVSPSIEQITGHSPAEVIGRHMTDFYVTPSSRDDFLAELQEHGEVRNFDAQLKTKAGGSVWISTSAHFWEDTAGNLLGVEGITRDIQQLRELQVELQKRKKLQALDHLTGGIAHDFNNFMAIILGSIDLIKPLLKDDELVNKRIVVIEQAASRGAELTSKLQAFSKTTTSELQTVDVSDLIRDMLPILDSSLTSEIQIDLELANSLWQVDVPTGELKDAIINLAINANHAMGGRGRLGISTSNLKLTKGYKAGNLQCLPGEYVVLTVSDTGVGIAEDIIDKIMDPFFTTKSKANGSGLGLSMVYGLAKRAHGDVAVESKLGEGAEFSLYLRRSKNRKQIEITSTSEEPPLGNKEKILFVEDEPDLRELGLLRLEQLGYEAIVAENGVMGREILESAQPIDLVFSDVIMPGGINGFELLKIARTLRPEIGILLCSGFAANENQTDLALEELPQILQKPFTILALAKALQENLEKGESNRTLN